MASTQWREGCIGTLIRESTMPNSTNLPAYHQLLAVKMMLCVSAKFRSVWPKILLSYSQFEPLFPPLGPSLQITEHGVYINPDLFDVLKHYISHALLCPQTLCNIIERVECQPYSYSVWHAKHTVCLSEVPPQFNHAATDFLWLP